MTLSITALSVGRVFGLQRPSFTYLRGWGETLDIPLIMYVIEGGADGPVVVDTGADLDRSMRYHRMRMEQTDDERPDVAVQSLGIDPADVRTIVNTHLHWDHSSNNHLFPSARVIVQQRELDFARAPVSSLRRQFEVLEDLEPAWMRGQEQLTPIEGDVELAPGITVISLPGHTPGSQGVLVDAGSTRYLIAGDCVYLYENWEGDAEVAHIPAGIFTDLVAFEDSFRRIEALECEVIPSHDPLVVERRVFE
jgi:N-acyl homoserine lactone hydrolase